jgi:hypothetical protein
LTNLTRTGSAERRDDFHRRYSAPKHVLVYQLQLPPLLASHARSVICLQVALPADQDMSNTIAHPIGNALTGKERLCT